MTEKKSKDDDHTLVMGVSFATGDHLVTPEVMGKILTLLEGCEVYYRYTNGEKFKPVSSGLSIHAFTQQEINQLKLEHMLETEKENGDG